MGVAAVRLSGIMAPAILRCRSLHLSCNALHAQLASGQPPAAPPAAAGHAPQGGLAARPVLFVLLPLPCSRFMHTRIEKEFETEEFLEGAKDAFHTGWGGAGVRLGGNALGADAGRALWCTVRPICLAVY